MLLLLALLAVQPHQSEKSALCAILLQPVKKKSIIFSQWQIIKLSNVKKKIIQKQENTVIPNCATNFKYCLVHPQLIPPTRQRSAVNKLPTLCRRSAGFSVSFLQQRRRPDPSQYWRSRCTADLYLTARLCWQTELIQIKMVKWYLTWLVTLATTFFFFFLALIPRQRYQIVKANDFTTTPQLFCVCAQIVLAMVCGMFFCLSALYQFLLSLHKLSVACS